MFAPDHESKDKRTGPRQVKDRNLIARPSPRRLLKNLATKAGMALVLAASAFGLGRLACQAPSLDPAAESHNHSGAGTVVFTEVLHLWLPDKLAGLAKHQFSQQVRSCSDLPRVLELQFDEEVWYVLTARCHQINGGFADISVIRRPCRDPQHFLELLSVLATAAGNPPRTLASDFSAASVHIFPDEFLKREPRDVVSALLGQIPTPSGSPSFAGVPPSSRLRDE
jgi:hypothetical protein